MKDQTEISGLTTIDYEQPAWRWTTLPCDKAIEITNAKTDVFSHSVLCPEEQMEFEWKFSQDSLR